MEPKKHTGVLDGFLETGTEGVIWIFEKDQRAGSEHMTCLENDDHLKVYGTNNSILFDGKIEKDFQIGRQKHPLNPSVWQPVALGLFIHWTQKGWEPDNWARLFIGYWESGDKIERLRAELIKAPKSKDMK